ncbi:pre-toxin TG domain-containing protein [Streptomyces celluloflavus]|uniref:pre-toxin TG domain-containing protein n=1 Tax=Streptomyces celluloflavus TaxID=58344 RepID=UPI0036C31634
MRNRLKHRIVVFALTWTMLFTGGISSAVAAESNSSDTDLAITKLLKSCQGLLPSKKIECMKSEAKELVGDSIEECSKESLARRLPCIVDRIKGEVANVRSLIWALHLIYQVSHDRDSKNSVLGNLMQMERIKENPLVLLEDKELLARLKSDLQEEIGELKGVDDNGNCRKDASLIGKLNCLRVEYMPAVTAKETMSWVAYTQILVMYVADRHEVGNGLVELQSDLSQIAADPAQLKDEKFREELIGEIREVRKRAVGNMDFWASYGRELRAKFAEIDKISEAANATTGGSKSDWSIGVGGPEWDKTFKDLEEGFAPGSDWDKIFGPNGSMGKTIKDLERTNKNLDQMNKDLDQTNKNLEQINKGLDQMNRDLMEMNKSVNAGMKSLSASMKSIDARMRDIDRQMAGLRVDVAEMRKIQNRKHPEVWDNLYKDLDLSSVGEYVRDGHMSSDENKVLQIIVSGILDLTPGVGDVKGVMEAASGKDTVSGLELTDSDRLIGSIVLLRWMKAGKKLITADELAAAMKAEKATGKIDGWMRKAAWEKVPDSLKGYESVNRKGVGYRWNDGKGNGVRIDKGNPNNPQVYQQVDHVVINSGGKIIGRNGKQIQGSIENDPREAHIPVDEWIKWKAWNQP